MIELIIRRFLSGAMFGAALCILLNPSPNVTHDNKSYGAIILFAASFIAWL